MQMPHHEQSVQKLWNQLDINNCALRCLNICKAVLLKMPLAAAFGEAVLILFSCLSMNNIFYNFGINSTKIIEH
jgi:hypothetical protein